ncbi:PAS domain-containing sensor histidine kinase [Labilibacter marinus]|uniref:PAS domain-containing sensor histidine kinase n=1 Tax=Labilibacter marinus TaxID=1477105 RepID=UPI00082BB80D|nr:PAS domain-containing protein [Labilibacter marinus]
MSVQLFQLIVIVALILIGVLLTAALFLNKRNYQFSGNINKEILKRIPDLVWVKDKDGVYLQCNNRFEDFFGAKASEIVGKTDYDFVDKELADMFRENDLMAIKKGKPSINQEEVVFANDGHKELLETIKTAIYDNSGKLIGVLGISRDVSDFIHYQEEVSNSKKILKDVLDAIPVRVFWKDVDLNYLGANQLFAEDAGGSHPGDIIGKSDYELFLKHEAELYRSDDKAVIDSGIPKISYEEPQTYDNGTQAWLSTSKIPLKNSTGEIYGILGTYKDITARKQRENDLANANKSLTQAKQELEESNAQLKDALEVASKSKELERLNRELERSHNDANLLNEELTATNEELFRKSEIIHEKNKELESVILNLKETQSQLLQAEKMASLGILTAGVAHEINNPLNYIMGGYLGISKYYNDVGEINKQEVPFLLESIKEGLDRANTIVKSLNQFSRANKDINEICDLNGIINNCIFMISNNIKHRIVINKNYDEDKLFVKGNAGELHQVFINVLTNAYQSIKDKGEISILTKVSEGRAVVQISDDGCGISAGNLKHVTDPFFTTKPPGVGTGLGLSITHSILSKHKGTIEFNSKENQGTIAKILLPIKE